MSNARPTQGAPTLVLERTDAPPEVTMGSEDAVVSTMAIVWFVLIAALVVLVIIARRRGWLAVANAWPLSRHRTDAEQCERAFLHLARGLRLGHAEAKLVRQMAQVIEAEAVALLISPSAFDRGSEGLKRRWSTAELYLERDVDALSALERKLAPGGECQKGDHHARPV